LLDSRHCQLLLDAGHSAILGQLDICAQSTVGQIRYRCVSLYRCNEI
jgi:nitrate reductase beta subunit